MDNAEPSNDYVRFDEIEDVLVSVELVALLAPLLDNHPPYWKWAIVGAHSSLQGAMVCALVRSAGTSVLRKEDAAKMLAWLNADFETRGEFRNINLLISTSFWVAAPTPTRPNSEPLLVLTPGQLKDIKRLHDHFGTILLILSHTVGPSRKPAFPALSERRSTWSKSS